MLEGLAPLVADTNLAAARSQMAISLGFHIIFAALGIGFTLITLIAHRRGLKRRDAAALTLAKRWSKVMAVLVAVGAVSGTNAGDRKQASTEALLQELLADGAGAQSK